MKMSLTLCRLLFVTAALIFAAQSARAQAGVPYVAEEVTVKRNGYALAGTLLLSRDARRPAPAVVMITGSGQQTRDSDIQMPGLEGYKPFKQIAEHLAGLGIAVLRVDDRGVGGSTGRETLAGATTSSFADDTRAQVAFLRAHRGIDPNRIALVGHSEGGSIALMVAASDPRVRSVVLMAAMGRTGREVNLEQQEYALSQMPGITEERKVQLREQQRQTLRAVVEGEDVSGLPPNLRPILPWFKEFLTYDPLPLIRRLKQPVLILQGGLDRQITPEHAVLLERAARGAGNGDVSSRVFPRLNHLFLPARTGAWSEYSALGTTSLETDLLEALGDWLLDRFQSAGERLSEVPAGSRPSACSTRCSGCWRAASSPLSCQPRAYWRTGGHPPAVRRTLRAHPCELRAAVGERVGTYLRPVCEAIRGAQRKERGRRGCRGGASIICRRLIT